MFLINPYILQASGDFVFNSVNDLAFSVRKVNDSYSGSCMRVRRSTDNAEQDIGFISGDLDTTAISTFCGANIGYIVKWYDQSGNSNDKINTTAANQPVIYNNGFTLRNGKPYISASSTQYLYLASSYSQLYDEDYTLFMTYEKSATGNQAILLDVNNKYSWLDYGTNQYIINVDPVTISSQYLANTLYLNNTVSDADAGTEIFRNGTSIGTRGANTVDAANFGGLRYLPSNLFRTATILFSEFIWYKEDKSASASTMRDNINNYYNIY
jgi:hypothetical protein